MQCGLGIEQPNGNDNAEVKGREMDASERLYIDPKLCPSAYCHCSSLMMKRQQLSSYPKWYLWGLTACRQAGTQPKQQLLLLLLGFSQQKVHQQSLVLHCFRSLDTWREREE